MRLADKVAIIASAGSGMGRASAIRFAQEGSKVVVADLNPQNGQETVDIILTNGGEAVFVHVNVTKENEVENMVRTAVEKYGKLNILFNNAGCPQLDKRFETITDDEWQNIMNVNVKGILLGVKYALPELKKAGNGAIVNNASLAGIMPWPGSAAYATSKGAAITLSKVLAGELAPFKIRVNVIAPGPTDTPMLPQFRKVCDDKVRKIIASALPLGRIVTPEDIANAALFLASDEASAITAVILEVDCGLHNGSAGSF